MTEKTTTARFGAGKITMVDRLIDEVSGPVRRARQEACPILHEPSTLRHQVAAGIGRLQRTGLDPQAVCTIENIGGCGVALYEHAVLIQNHHAHHELRRGTTIKQYQLPVAIERQMHKLKLLQCSPALASSK